MNKLKHSFSIALLAVGVASCSGGSSSGGAGNTAPTVNAGEDFSAVAGNQVDITASVTDPDNDISTVKWTQVSGVAVTMADDSLTTLSFTAPDSITDGTLVFQIEVTDSQLNSASDTVSVSVSEKRPNAVAKAGPDRTGSTTTVYTSPKTEEIVFIDGSESSGNTFLWSVTSAPANSLYQLSSKNTPSTAFYGDTTGNYTLTLTSDNGQGSTAEDEVTVTLLDDADADGITDSEDLDRDGDGFLNDNDEFPDNKAAHLDFDSDGESNYEEADVDGDGVSDSEDDFPLDNTRSALTVYSESKEPTTANANDGISVSEATGTGPMEIRGSIYSTAGPDIDYYSVNLAAGIYSAVVYGDSTDLTPTITLIDAAAVTLPSSRANFIDLPGISSVGVAVPADGDYYLVITDATGRSDEDWGYRIKLIKDMDMDGLSDDLEQAIDSNHLSADSDADNIPDFIEHRFALQASANADSDNDGVPAWWDMDSDADYLPDSVEFYLSAEKPGLSANELFAINDADNDGTPNFLDTVSDGNVHANDFQQAGANPLSPVDSDKDGLPDFIDQDDDNDGLSDSSESADTYNVALASPGENNTNVADGLLIKSLVNTDRGLENLCFEGETLSVELVNGPANAANLQGVFNTLDGALVQTAGTLTDNVATFTCPADLASGLVEFYLAAEGKRSGAIPLQVQTGDMPILTGLTKSTSSSYVTLKGDNLDAELTVNFEGGSTTVYNTYGSSSEASFYLSSNAESGYVSVSSAAGDSNPVWLNLKRSISGTIDSPNETIDVTKLDVSFAVDEEVFPSSGGYFQTEARVDSPTTVTALLETPDSTEDQPRYGLHLSGVIFPDQYSITLDAESTAMALIWDGIGVSELIQSSALEDTYQDISELSEIQALVSLLSGKLAANAFVIAEGDAELTSSLSEAISAAASVVDSSPSRVVSSALNPRRQIAGMFGADATVTPTEADDISVYEHNDSGNITVENDSQLYLSVKITATDGTVLQNHITGLNGMAGPQGYGLLFWASSTQFKQPKGRNALVEVISPGIGTEYDPTTVASMSVWKKLYFRTAVERVILPLLKEILPLPDSDIVDIIWANAPGVVDIVVTKASQGDVSGSVKALVDLVWQDIASVPPGDITKALAKKLGKDVAEKILAKIAAKIGAKFVPGVGQIALAYEIAGAVNTGTNVAKTIADIGSTDAVIHFNVVFPLSIEEVSPGKVLPDGTDMRFDITGSGFTQIQRGWWPFESYLKPTVKFTDADGIVVTTKINSINADGTSMNVTVPGWYLDDSTKGPLSVEINHPNDNSSAMVSKADAVEIVSNVELSSISPSSGGVGIQATIYGAGFSDVLSENRVTIGGESALVSSASESGLGVVIPTSLDEGLHSVSVDVYKDDAWVSAENVLSYEVVQGDVSIVVCDNGGDKDDAFALYVDGLYIGTMYASNSDYCDTYTPSLNAGSHTAMLLGVEAPDSVGTYSIDFNGVTNLTGASRSGDDLTPGVQKSYQFDVEVSIGVSDQNVMETAPYMAPKQRYRPSAED